MSSKSGINVPSFVNYIDLLIDEAEWHVAEPDVNVCHSECQ